MFSCNFCTSFWGNKQCNILKADTESRCFPLNPVAQEMEFFFFASEFTGPLNLYSIKLTLRLKYMCQFWESKHVFAAIKEPVSRSDNISIHNSWKTSVQNLTSGTKKKKNESLCFIDTVWLEIAESSKQILNGAGKTTLWLRDASFLPLTTRCTTNTQWSKPHIFPQIQLWKQRRSWWRQSHFTEAAPLSFQRKHWPA